MFKLITFALLVALVSYMVMAFFGVAVFWNNLGVTMTVCFILYLLRRMK